MSPTAVVIYQEQVMQICRELAGFSFGQADNVRRAMSKKKLKVMEAEREHFVHGCKEPGKECAGCVANGMPEDSCQRNLRRYDQLCVLRLQQIPRCLLRLRGVPDCVSQMPLPA